MDDATTVLRVTVATADLPEAQVHQAIREALRRGLVSREKPAPAGDLPRGRIKRLVEEALYKGE
jgi:hypothetical protein